MWNALEDAVTCRNTVMTSRMMSMLITLFGFAILGAGVADVVSVTTVCPRSDPNAVPFDYSYVAVGIWGSLPIIVTGILANFLIDNTAYTVKFLQLSAMVSGGLFAPAVIVISALDAALSNRVCGNVNSYAIAVCLSAFGGAACFFLGILVYRLYCSRPADDDQRSLVRAQRAQRVYAKKDEFMVSDVPQDSEWNNGAAKGINVSQLPVHNIHVALNGGQGSQMALGYGQLQQQQLQQQLQQQQWPQNFCSNQRWALVQAPFNASPKQQLALAQMQQSQVVAAGQTLQPLAPGGLMMAGGAPVVGGGGYKGGAVVGGALAGGASGQAASNQEGYYVTFLDGNKVVTNAYPQIYRMN